MMTKYEITKSHYCGDCLHYRRHYICWEGDFFPLKYGHCVFPRRKKRTPENTCPHWVLTDGKYNVPAKKCP